MQSCSKRNELPLNAKFCVRCLFLIHAEYSKVSSFFFCAEFVAPKCPVPILLHRNVVNRVTLNDDEHVKEKAALLQIALSLKHHEKRRCGANLFKEENQSNRIENFSFYLRVTRVRELFFLPQASKAPQN